MSIISWLRSSFWFGNSSVAEAKALVEVRTASLETNSKAIEDIAQLSPQLQACFDILKAANPKLFEILATPSSKPITEEEMCKMIKILTLAAITDLRELRQTLKQSREETARLVTADASWQRINDIYDKVLESCDRAQGLDRANVQELTELRVMVQSLGLPPTCHTDSIL